MNISCPTTPPTSAQWATTVHNSGIGGDHAIYVPNAQWQWQGSNDGVTWVNIGVSFGSSADISVANITAGTPTGFNINTTAWSAYTGTGVIQSGIDVGTQLLGNTTFYRYYKLIQAAGTTIVTFNLVATNVLTNATGTLKYEAGWQWKIAGLGPGAA
jgi:hypothetical protein